MAEYKVVDAEQLDADLVMVADRIRSISGNTATLSFPSGFRAEMDEAVEEIGVQADMIAQIKAALLAEVPNRLPEGYTELEYIESTGTQYIDTGFIPDQDSRIIVEFVYFGGSGIYGARTSTTSNNFALRSVNGVWQPGYGGTLGSTGISIDNTNWHIADQNKNVFSVDGEVGYTFTEQTFKAPKSIAIGGINAANQVYYGLARYQACKIYDNGTLIRDYVPCVNADDEAGFYDLANAQFYTNAGTGDFVAGPEV